MRETTVTGKQYDEERALYALKNATVRECVFAGEADGESVLKECREIEVDACSFSLRYPLWHAEDFIVRNSSMDTLTRAPIWYSHRGEIAGCTVTGIKALRECTDITVRECDIRSAEFGWKCDGIKISDSIIDSEYLLFDSNNVSISNLKMSGKYSFQYMKNLHITDSILDTKDAFWHSTGVTVENSVVKGEYLGWFSNGLTLINCHISGTQPLCYCKNLKLINCTMEGTDLSFEYSDVEADVSGHIISVKNARSGYIVADSIGEIILEDSVFETLCNIKTRTL